MQGLPKVTRQHIRSHFQVLIWFNACWICLTSVTKSISSVKGLCVLSRKFSVRICLSAVTSHFNISICLHSHNLLSAVVSTAAANETAKVGSKGASQKPVSTCRSCAELVVFFINGVPCGLQWDESLILSGEHRAFAPIFRSHWNTWMSKIL